MNKHISIDIESLATTSDAVILSIGAVVFDASGLFDTFYTVLDFESDQTGRRQCPRTAAWWDKQSTAARDALVTDVRDPVLFALGRLHEFVNIHDHEGIWALGTHFDIAALEHLHTEYAVAVPWHYQSPRDMRTVRAQFMKKFPAGSLDHIEGGVAHRADDDAIRQARALIHMNQQLGGHIL